MRNKKKNFKRKAEHHAVPSSYKRYKIIILIGQKPEIFL